MNKKAAIFHWILFGFLIALGVFLLVAFKSDFKLTPHGQWQADFLTNHYFAAEKDLLQIDQTAKQSVWDAVLRLSNTSGFSGSIPCGQVQESPINNYVLWNDQNKKCLPQIEKEFLKEVEKNLKKRLPERKYSNLKLKKNIFAAQGDKEKKKSQSSAQYYVQYTYDTSFNLNLGFDLVKEYNQLGEEAVKLVRACQKKSNLESCIKKYNKKNQQHWKLKTCDQEKFFSQGRKVVFCVESPTKIKVYNRIKQLTSIRHKIALDFTKT